MAQLALGRRGEAERRLREKKGETRVESERELRPDVCVCVHAHVHVSLCVCIYACVLACACVRGAHRHVCGLEVGLSRQKGAASTNALGLQ